MANEQIESDLQSAIDALNSVLMNDECPTWLATKLTDMCSALGWAIDDIHYGQNHSGGMNP